jgi:micrococcal nuclease
MIRTALPIAMTLLALTTTMPQAQERQERFGMCGRDRHTCVVDGDTIWLDGMNLRLEAYDTPEPYNDICGGQAEIALAHQASARLLQLLNSNPFTVETAGTDRYGRVLATLRIGGTDVGDILISEGLARRWPDGDEWWCR